MQKCKYLDDLGIDIDKYGTNFMPDNDERQPLWERERAIYGFDRREIWNLDMTFVEWIYTRLMMYKEHSCVDFSFHKFKFKSKVITQGEAIDYILKWAKEILLDPNNDELRYKNSRRICTVWKEILPVMWW